MNINVEQIPSGKWRENCYVVSNKDRDALIIGYGSGANVNTNIVKREYLSAKLY